MIIFAAINPIPDGCADYAAPCSNDIPTLDNAQADIPTPSDSYDGGYIIRYVLISVKIKATPQKGLQQFATVLR